MSEGQRLQIINENGVFTSTLRDDLKKWNVLDKGLDYFVVAVLGCQSSGKSTLLNLLFGTQFDVLNVAKTQKRQQTTLGVWMGKSGPEKSTILVFDVEGTDSKERGEDHWAWERKTSLFSLALSEILMINLWSKDIGRFEGANYGLLKNIFELNLQLFQASRGKAKTLLYFVFRDHDEESEGNLENISKHVTKDINDLWNSINKPEQFARAQITEFFDFKFEALPHIRLAKKEFDEGIKAMKDKFTNESNPNFVLDQQYKIDIPADGFPKYAQSIWEAILSEKDLDLPTQKQMLSIYRCEELAKEASQMFEENFIPIQEKLDNDVIDDEFGKKLNELVEQTLSQYDNTTKRYDEKVIAAKKEGLLLLIESKVQPAFRTMIKMIYSSAKEEFNKLLGQELEQDEPSLNFVKKAKSIRENVLAKFDATANNSLLTQFKWNFNSEKDDLQKYMTEKIRVEKESQLEKFANKEQNTTQQAIYKAVNKFFEDPKSDMWLDISTNYETERENAERRFSKILEAFDEPKDSKWMKRQSEKSFQALKNITWERSKTLDILMDNVFKNLFELDANLVPRRWSPSDNVENVWLSAKREAEKLVDLFSAIRLSRGDFDVKFYKVDDNGKTVAVDDPKIEEDKKVLSAEEAKRVLSNFQNKAQNAFITAKREQERVASQKFPFAILAIIGILGFNEALWLLGQFFYNPFFTLLCLFLGGLAYMVWKMNLHPHLLRVANSFVEDGLAKAQDQINAIRNGAPAGAGAGAAGNGAAGSAAGRNFEKTKTS